MPPKPGAPQAWPSPAGNACVAKMIVTLALVGISQHAICFGRFFEFFFRARVARVFVGVILDRQSAVRTFHFLVSGGATDS